MQISKKVIERTTVIEVAGSIDANNADELTSYLTGSINAGNCHIVVDLSQVNFMSSAGLRAILAGLKESKRFGGELQLAAAQPGVEKTLRISGFTSILNLFPNLEEAVSSSEDRQQTSGR
jgi:anti-sigma B factor antagonist